MTWDDYIKGYNNLNEYMKEKYGERGKYMIQTMESRRPLRLSCQYRLVNSIEEMVFGQFIIAERALTSGFEQNEALFHLANAIIRPYGDIIFDNTDIFKEKKNIDSISNEHAKDVMTECIAFSEMRNVFVKEDFRGVFYKTEEEDDDEDDDDFEEEGETFEGKFNKDWYWYTIIDALANNDILKHEAILMLKMKDVAPHLSYMRMKGIIEYKKRKAEEMAIKMRTR